MNNEKLAIEISEQIEKIEKKYNIKIGVWASWRDLYNSLDALKLRPDVEEVKFTLSVRLNDGKDATKKNNKSKS